MLTKCPECELQVSDKAAICPHCGYPLKSSHQPLQTQRKPRTHMRLPNGFGQITEIKYRNLRKPFRVMVSVGKDPNTGRPISRLLKPEAYFETYNEAYAALVEYNKSPYDISESITISDLYTLWSEKHLSENINTRKAYAQAWRVFEPIYDIEVMTLRPKNIILCLENAPSPAISNKALGIMRLMLDYAVEHELIPHNYARDIKPQPVSTNPKAHMAFTDDEIAKLWKYQSSPYVCYILLQTYMGWRPQELCDLKKENVDWMSWTITGGMKTAAGIDRVVPVHKDLIPILKKIKKLSDSLDSEYLCPTLKGRKLGYTYYYDRFREVMGEIGIDERHKPHDPRKTFITLAKTEEVNEYAIKYIVGHAIGDVTEKFYTERGSDWLRKELEKIKIPQI